MVDVPAVHIMNHVLSNFRGDIMRQEKPKFCVRCGKPLISKDIERIDDDMGTNRFYTNCSSCNKETYVCLYDSD